MRERKMAREKKETSSFFFFFLFFCFSCDWFYMLSTWLVTNNSLKSHNRPRSKQVKSTVRFISGYRTYQKNCGYYRMTLRVSSLFGFVFKFCFHHSILWFLSDKLWNLKTHFRCFKVIKTKLWWHFCKYTHIEGPTVRGLVATFDF